MTLLSRIAVFLVALLVVGGVDSQTTSLPPRQLSVAGARISDISYIDYQVAPAGGIANPLDDILYCKLPFLLSVVGLPYNLPPAPSPCSNWPVSPS